jgi:hypothetical protein
MVVAPAEGIAALITGVAGASFWTLAIFLKNKFQESKEKKAIQEQTGIYIPKKGSDSGMVTVVSQLVETLRSEGQENRKTIGEMFGLIRGLSQVVQSLVIEAQNTKQHFDQTHAFEQNQLQRIEGDVRKILERPMMGSQFGVARSPKTGT